MAFSAMFMGLFATITAFAASLIFFETSLIVCLVVSIAFGSFITTSVVLIAVMFALRELDEASQSDQFKNLSS